MQRRNAFVLLGALVVGCASSTAEQPAAKPASAAAEADHATAEMFPVGRHRARGVIQLAMTEKGLMLRGRVDGLPAGNYGFSIHEKGDCSSPDGKSVGAYFNPGEKQGKPLGLLEDVNAAKGDFVKLSRVEEKLSLSGPESLVGKAIVIHAWPYDEKVDPSTIPYVSCGVIRAE